MYKLSIITPIYNVEKYIERCARSLFKQMLTDVEFIFINDKSPDGSIDVLKRVISEFPQLQDSIHIVEHAENRGLAVTRITGIGLAQGEYVAFCDSDDWVDPNMYQNLYQEAKRTDADLVYCNYCIEFPSKSVSSNLLKVRDRNEYICSLLMGSLPSFSWIRLYRREKLLAYVKELYKPGIDMWEDTLMNIRFAFRIQVISFVPLVGYHYNQCNVNSYTSVWSEKSQNNIREVVRLVSETIDRQGGYQFPLSCFRLNAYYSIFSHSSIDDLKKRNWPYWFEDGKYIWNHSNMSIDNKLFLELLRYRLYEIAYAYMWIKRKIRKIILSQ